MSTFPNQLSDAELAQSQWIGIGEIVQLMQTSAEVSRADALRALKLRGLADVRPAVLDVLNDVTRLSSCDDQHACRCIEKVLTPHEDWIPMDTDDPAAATVEFHKVAIIDWMKGLNLDLPSDNLKKWKSDTLPELKKRGLLISVPSRKTPTDATNLVDKYAAKIIRLSDAPSYLGVNKNKFNRDIRPLLHELALGDRSVGFNRSELDNFIDKQTDQDTTKELEPWELPPKNGTARLASSSGETSGTSSARSATPKLDAAFKQVTADKQKKSMRK